jgi:hypothetical protein
MAYSACLIKKQKVVYRNMANGLYGANIPALINDNDISKYVDIYYSYSETRNSSDVESAYYTKLGAENLKNVILTTDDSESSNDTIVEGLYNLKLPSNIFGTKGFYTIYIKPKEVSVTIDDVATLKDFPSVRGIVINTNNVDDDIKSQCQTNNALTGYRIIYKDSDGSRLSDTRIVTSNNRCEPVAVSTQSTSSNSYAYQFNENASYTFLTVSPSLPLSFKASSNPFIGRNSQDIYLVNTLFEPICIELEMVENDADTITNLLTGTQLRDLSRGLITTFDKSGNIIAQHELSTLRSDDSDGAQYELKYNRSANIDSTQTLDDKVSD